MTVPTQPASAPDYGARRLTVELTNFCNLHCSYCVRDDDALHHDPVTYLPVDLFARIAREARDAMGIEQVVFTGGEPTLHRRFGDLLASVVDLSLTCSFVTNGWHFERVWPLLVEHRQALTHVSFSLDGVTREAHDRWRGQGSFDRVVRAFSRCWAAGLPFSVKVGVRRDTVPDLERFAIFAARMGAAGLSFAHLMPTSASVADTSALTIEERAAAEREIAQLARIFRMRISIDVGYYNVAQAAPCSPLHGVSANINDRGQLTLCCNLSGFRGAAGAVDIVADLNQEPFGVALERLQRLASAQSERRSRSTRYQVTPYRHTSPSVRTPPAVGGAPPSARRRARRVRGVVAASRSRSQSAGHHSTRASCCTRGPVGPHRRRRWSRLARGPTRSFAGRPGGVDERCDAVHRSGVRAWAPRDKGRRPLENNVH